MTGLFDLLQADNLDRTAIVGMTKNVGKTVTLNYLVKCFERSGITLGLLSAGYDGERFDRLTLKDKPRIYAPAGSYLATAKACFDTADAVLDLVDKSSLSTPLGPVLLGRVKEAGLVELAGPGNLSGLVELAASLSALGAGHVLVDGAINRLASASPRVSKGTILASGATLGPVMEDVVRKTIFRRELFELPEIEDASLCSAALEGLSGGNAVLLHREGDSYRVESIRAMIPLLAGAQLIERCRRDTAALVFGGALVDESLRDIMEIYPQPPAVIVGDATRIFISPELFYRFRSRGGEIMVLNKIRLLAVTLNPTDPCGRGYDPVMFLERMTEVLKPCPVFDLVLEQKNSF